MPRVVKNAKIALLDFSLQKAKMKMGVQVLVDDPEKLEAIRQRWLFAFTVLYRFLNYDMKFTVKIWNSNIFVF